jgi:hypothetical protein
LGCGCAVAQDMVKIRAVSLVILPYSTRSALSRSTRVERRAGKYEDKRLNVVGLVNRTLAPKASGGERIFERLPPSRASLTTGWASSSGSAEQKQNHPGWLTLGRFDSHVSVAVCHQRSALFDGRIDFSRFWQVC